MLKTPRMNRDIYDYSKHMNEYEVDKQKKKLNQKNKNHNNTEFFF